MHSKNFLLGKHAECGLVDQQGPVDGGFELTEFQSDWRTLIGRALCHWTNAVASSPLHRAN